jgi:hypothetical protein
MYLHLIFEMLILASHVLGCILLRFLVLFVVT